MAIPANWSEFSNFDAERLALTANRHLPAAVSLVLVVLLAWQLARLAWLLVPGSPAGDPIDVAPPPGTPASATRPGAERLDVESIANAHLFGEARPEDEAPPPPPEPAENLEETRLALTLKGTMAGTEDRLTAAIIADNRNDEKVYAVGDVVVPGTTLHSVYRDRVVLNRNGNLEALKLPKDLPKGSSTVGRAPMTTRTTGTATESRSIQSALTENAAKLADVIRPTPYFVGGQQQGYRVYPGRDRKQFAALGLRPGDLIRDIDGQALTDPQQAMEIFQNLGTADQVSVTVERNGQPEVLVLSTSQLELGEEDAQE